MKPSRGADKGVLFLSTGVFANGGIQRFNQTLLHAFEQLGIRYRVLSLNDSPQAIAKGSKLNGDSITGFNGDRRRFVLAVFAEIMRNRYEWVLIGHVNFAALAMMLLAPRRLHVPRTMLIAHGIEVWDGIDGLRRLALQRVDRILCVSRYTRRRILEQAPSLAADQLVIFPNAIADTWARVAPQPFGRHLPPRFILSVTRLEPGDRYKGIATVIEAFSMLADRAMQYYVIGQGADLPFLQLVAERCGVKDRVHFVQGASDSELTALYQKCTAFVLPSGKEGFGIVFLEAMFFGAPVIAAREKGAMDVVLDGETGISVDFGDVVAVKQSIEALASDGPLRERLRANGRSLVTDGGAFTFASFMRRCAEVFGPDATAA
jgi:phosphatidyl-myo-inositol dimannoside synthase